MARLVVPDAIRIEDEVWQEAFARKIPDRRNGRPAPSNGTARSAAGARPRPLPGPDTRPRTDLAPVPAEVALRPGAPVGALRSDLGPIADRAPGPTTEFASTHPTVVTPIDLTPNDNRAPAGDRAPARRTVVIRGRGAERNLPWPTEPRRRPALRAHERAGFRPDRVAMWAVMLCILLCVVAAISGHG